MKIIWEKICLFFQSNLQRISANLYVPTQTGSHEIGVQYLGDLASSYIEHKNFPAVTNPSFRGIKIIRP